MEQTPIRINYSYNYKVTQDWQSENHCVGITLDVKPNETPDQTYERAYNWVHQKIDKLKATQKPLEAPTSAANPQPTPQYQSSQNSPPPPSQSPSEPGSYCPTFGKYEGQKISEIDPDQLRNYVEFLNKKKPAQLYEDLFI